MDKGHIMEFSSPAALLRDHKSWFYAVCCLAFREVKRQAHCPITFAILLPQLCKATGPLEFDSLCHLAKEAERRRQGEE